MIDLIMLHHRSSEMAIPIETNASEIEYNQRAKRNWGTDIRPICLDTRFGILDLSKPLQLVLQPDGYR